MPRSVQITKEKILTAALDVLIREGYSAVSIKSIAKELKCSTQPIAWQFGNMDNMREALTREAVTYANQKMMPTSTNCIEAFWQIGYAYINLAFDTPNLFRFVYMGESRNYCRGGFNSILTDRGNAVLIDKLYQYLNISREQADILFQRMIVYTHGIVSLVVAGVLNCTREQVYSIVKDFGLDLLSLTGANLDVQAIISSITEVISQ
ncbi:MAG: TetR/AcrR family transcriptional regulator [Lachnospiraceae bacterium]|nr:TetR/AcrR family transcriptional regulator [Lachnospiraceae bacterium]